MALSFVTDMIASKQNRVLAQVMRLGMLQLVNWKLSMQTSMVYAVAFTLLPQSLPLNTVACLIINIYTGLSTLVDEIHRDDDKASEKDKKDKKDVPLGLGRPPPGTVLGFDLSNCVDGEVQELMYIPVSPQKMRKRNQRGS